MVFGGGGSFEATGFVGGTNFCGVASAVVPGAFFDAAIFAGFAALFEGVFAVGFAAIGDLVERGLLGDAVEPGFGDLDLGLSSTVVFFWGFTVFASLMDLAGFAATVGLFLLGLLGSFFDEFAFVPEVGFAEVGFAFFKAFDFSAAVFLAEAAGFLAGAGFFLEVGTGRLLGGEFGLKEEKSRESSEPLAHSML